MPAYGIGIEMSDAEVAAVLTYVRSSWGNNGERGHGRGRRAGARGDARTTPAR